MNFLALSKRSLLGMPAISSGNATFSITVRHGKVDSSWNTMPIAGCGPRTVSPPTVTAPLYQSSKPPMILNNVDLPHPEGPITARNSPGRTLSETRSTAISGPSGVSNCLTMSSTTRTPASAGVRAPAASDFGVVATLAIRRNLFPPVASISSPACGGSRGPTPRALTRGDSPLTNPSPASEGRELSQPASLSRLPLRHCTGIARAVTRLDAHVDHRHFAVLHRRNRLLERRCQLVVLGDRSESPRALGAGQPRHVNLGVEHLLADPFVVDRPVAQDRHALLVNLIIVERTIVGHHDKQRNAVVHRSPQRRHRHQEIAVAADPDGQPARSLEGKRRSDRYPGAAADTPATVGAEEVQRVAEVPE